MDSETSQVGVQEKLVPFFDGAYSSTSGDGASSSVELTDFDGRVFTQDVPKNISIHLCKNYKIKICKALIPLKLSLFIYYGAGSFMPSFLTILYKQRGISLSELSTMTIVSPMFQFLGTAFSGIAADKLGRAKPILFANLLIYISVLICILLLPNINHNNKVTNDVNITCHDGLQTQSNCKVVGKEISLESCQSYCLEELSQGCLGANYSCQLIEDYEREKSLFIHINQSSVQKTDEFCGYNVWTLSYENISCACFIEREQQKYYLQSCKTTRRRIPFGLDSEISGLLMAYVVLYVLFQTTYSNCYRCLDITCMFLVKEHDSSFGHERFFGMLGNVLLSPFAGYIVTLTTPPKGQKNYSTGIYLAIGMNFLLLFVLCKLPVKVNSPGQKMWKKSFNLLKNVDAVVFLIVILILGTAWNIGKYFLFWHLEELNAPSLLVGLITSVSALYGLPFLLTSKWWVKKIGLKQIFVLALLGYAVNSAGYSFLKDPWFSLLLEATGTISYYLLWVAVIEFSHDLAPEGLRATIIAIAGAIHFSIGKVSSGLMGKFLMDRYGGRNTFLFSAIFYATSALLYGLYVYITNKCSRRTRQIIQTGVQYNF